MNHSDFARPRTYQRKKVVLARITGTTLALALFGAAGYAWQKGDALKQGLNSIDSSPAADDRQVVLAPQQAEPVLAETVVWEAQRTQAVPVRSADDRPALKKIRTIGILLRRSAETEVSQGGAGYPAPKAAEQQSTGNQQEFQSRNSQESRAGSGAAALCAIAMEHMASGDHEDALTEFSSALSRLPVEAANQSTWSVQGNDLDQHQFEALLYQSRACVRLAESGPDACLEDLTRAIELSPDTAENYANRGKIYQQMGLLDRAINDYRKARMLERGY